MTFMLSFGKYGGFYFHADYSVRLCLGWVALTIIPADIDPILTEWKELRWNKLIKKAD